MLSLLVTHGIRRGDVYQHPVQYSDLIGKEIAKIYEVHKFPKSASERKQRSKKKP